jgi:hypothetical protein
MRSQLEVEEQNSPYKINVNRVLPGVNQRLDMILNQVQNYGDEMKNLRSNLTNDISQVVGGVVHANRSELARHYATLALHLSSYKHASTKISDDDDIVMESATTTTNNNTENSSATDTDNENDDMSCYALLTLTNPIISIQQMYNEYYGLGDFKEKPIVGGRFSLDEKFGSRWRKNFQNGDKGHYNRCRRLCRILIEKAKEVDINVAIDEMQLQYESKRRSLLGLCNAYVVNPRK